MDVHLSVSLIVLGQLALVAAVFLKQRPLTSVQLLAGLLLLSVMGYVVVSNPVLAGRLSFARPVTLGLAILPPYLLWAFARLVFEFRTIPAPYRPLVYLVPLAAWLGAIAGEPGGFVDIVHDAHRVTSLALLAHVTVSTVLGRPDDLMEQRRWYRVWFVLLVAVQAVAVLVVELFYRADAVPESLQVINIVAITALVMALALPMLQPSVHLFWGQADAGTPPSMPSGAPRSRPSDLESELRALMHAGYYTTTGLTIGALAEQLGVPEHQLRALINGHLGFRNFSAFVNGYRIDAAKARLRDLDLIRTPILTIALDLGYASIGPFNRAFKASTSLTPTEFRAQHTAGLADSEKT